MLEYVIYLKFAYFHDSEHKLFKISHNDNNLYSEFYQTTQHDIFKWFMSWFSDTEWAQPPAGAPVG